MLKIDTHAHYLPRDWPDLARKYGDDRFPVIQSGLVPSREHWHVPLNRITSSERLSFRSCTK